jgi:hypothetical protein
LGCSSSKITRSYAALGLVMPADSDAVKVP